MVFAIFDMVLTFIKKMRLVIIVSISVLFL